MSGILILPNTPYQGPADSEHFYAAPEPPGAPTSEASRSPQRAVCQPEEELWDPAGALGSFGLWCGPILEGYGAWKRGCIGILGEVTKSTEPSSRVLEFGLARGDHSQGLGSHFEAGFGARRCFTIAFLNLQS